MGETEPAHDLRDELLALERALAVRDPSGIPGGLATLIAPDFLEFGQSGRAWTGSEIIGLLGNAIPPAVSLSVEDATVDRLAEDVALVTYRLVVSSQPDTMRSSVWVRRDGRWQLRFHQGTRRS